MKNIKKDFNIEDYLSKQEHKKESFNRNKKIQIKRFNALCQEVKHFFENEWDMASGNFEKILMEHKRAIIGHEKEVAYFKDKIKEYIYANNLREEWKPDWYANLVDGIYHELWGLVGLSEWFAEKYKESSSAKIIGDRIYFLVHGKTVLMPQRIETQRRKQLIKALLLNTPEKRIGDNYHEVYMLDGSRITIFTGDLTKLNQEVLVLRKFFVKEFSFEKQAELETIPKEAMPLFKNMIQLGYNVAFTGAVRTAKTTFLSTWQSYEDPKLEGVMVETDPEIPLHKIMPSAPIMQLIADEKQLHSITKSILRSDADYIVMAEARDGIALNIAVKAANKGTRRVKITFHTTDVLDFCYDVADEIVRVYGGSLYSTLLKVAKSFQFVFHFVQLQDKSQKRLKAIYNIHSGNKGISFHKICQYDLINHQWLWKNDLGKRTQEIGAEEDPQCFEKLLHELNQLSMDFPLEGETISFPYQHLQGISYEQ